MSDTPETGMKTLTLLIAVALIGCNPDNNITDQEDRYTVDENGAQITIKRIDYDGKKFYISETYRGYWILGPEITKPEP
jgi:hypothetical protein